MGAISVRVPDELETRLNREADLAQLPRSAVVREAIADLVVRRERERFLGEYIAEARRGYADPALHSEALALAEESVELDNEALALAEALPPAQGPSLDALPDPAGAPWWR